MDISRGGSELGGLSMPDGECYATNGTPFGIVLKMVLDDLALCFPILSKTALRHRAAYAISGNHYWWENDKGCLKIEGF